MFFVNILVKTILPINSAKNYNYISINAFDRYFIIQSIANQQQPQYYKFKEKIKNKIHTEILNIYFYYKKWL